MELPNTKAFQDEFTRNLLDSQEEVEEGYYLFESDTGGYSMLWPKDAIADGPPFYQRNGNGFEKILFDNRSEEGNYHYSYSTTYETDGDLFLEASLVILSDSVRFSGEYEIIETEKTKIYYGKLQDKLEAQNRSATSYHFFSYIVSKNSNKGMEFIYSVNCLDELHTQCNLDAKKEEETALYLMKKVSFNREE
ncbi:hypothetical protein [Bacillus weihaiensis]|uniref:hypothetical protein n=1 Tax=Bacillus weihaiensis TaxID=1547283 RepID=UPI0023545759|nr:hypothetical protein [Bacillus weihaiensis]